MCVGWTFRHAAHASRHGSRKTYKGQVGSTAVSTSQTSPPPLIQPGVLFHPGYSGIYTIINRVCGTRQAPKAPAPPCQVF